MVLVQMEVINPQTGQSNKQPLPHLNLIRNDECIKINVPYFHHFFFIFQCSLCTLNFAIHALYQGLSHIHILCFTFLYLFITATFKTPLKDNQVKVGSSIQFECETTSSDTQIKWLKNEQGISSNDNYIITQHDCIHQLEIQNAALVDGGQYSCMIVDTMENTTAHLEVWRELVSFVYICI